MEKEFKSLSKKLKKCIHDEDSVIWAKDVKEFIRLLKEWNTKYVFGDISKDINKVIDKLAGEELSK